MIWEIFYDDETVVSDLDVTWTNAPSQGVLFVLEYMENNNKMVHMGMDYYFMRDGTVISTNLNGLHSHLELGLGAGAIKFGRWCPNDIWQRVHDVVFPSN